MNKVIDYENLGKLNASFEGEYAESFNTVLRTGWYVLGEQVKKFEADYAKFCGSKYCIGMSNGLDALTIALKTFDFKKNSEIIVPSNTFIATILSIVQAGLKPVLVEPELSTYNIDPALIETKISKNTVAIMVVHLYGKCCRMEPILTLARKHSLKVIEDCAQSHGASFNGIISGNFGDIAAHSFYPTKNLGALGDAGATTTNDALWAEKMKSLRNYGSKVKYYNDYAGYNSRLDELQAGFLSIKLAKLHLINEHKRKLASLYLNHLKNDFIKPVVEKDFYDVYHIFAIRHPKRDEIKKYLLDHQIKTEIHYPIPPHKQQAMKGIIEDGSYSLSEEIHRTVLSLPISFCHTEDEILYVIETLNKF